MRSRIPLALLTTLALSACGSSTPAYTRADALAEAISLAPSYPDSGPCFYMSGSRATVWTPAWTIACDDPALPGNGPRFEWTPRGLRTLVG